MKLYCENNNKLILNNLIVARNFYSRFLGLMFKDRLGDGEGLLLSPCNGIHTFFMRFPIDVIFLDSNFRVIKIIPEMVPNRFSPFVKGASKVLELSAKSSDFYELKEGDKLVLG